MLVRSYRTHMGRLDAPAPSGRAAVVAVVAVVAFSIANACGHSAPFPKAANTEEPLRTATAACIKDVTPTESRVYSCGGLTFDVSIPAACAHERCGLIFDVHGLTMNGRIEDNNTHLAALGREHGYIVVNPNATPAAPKSRWDHQGADDAAIFVFMQEAIDAFHVDERRVHFTGFSQGGDMTWRFLCAHSDVLASVAPAAFGLSKQTRLCFAEGQRGGTPRPILYMHGRRDALVNFSIAKDARDAVVASQGLSVSGVVSSDKDYRRTRYSNDSGQVFEFIEHRYISESKMLRGHCFPGSTDSGEEEGQWLPLGCKPPNAFNWGEEVMRFFMAHPQPPEADSRT